MGTLQDEGVMLASPGAKTLDTCEFGAAIGLRLRLFLKDIFSSEGDNNFKDLRGYIFTESRFRYPV